LGGVGTPGAVIVWKWLVGGFLVCVAVCGAGGYFIATNKELRKQFEQVIPRPKPPEVRQGAVEIGELSRTVSAPGQVEPLTSVKISAQVSARILALPFELNNAVKKNDVLVRLDSEDLAALLESARASLMGEQARLEGAESSKLLASQELDRVKKLASTGDRTPADVERAQSEFDRAVSTIASSRASIDAAKAQIARAQKDLDNTIIKAPIDGVITKLDAKVGEVVVIGTLNNPGSVIMEIADLSQMILKARVDESNIVPVKEGQTAKVFINAYGEREFKGRVSRVELQRKVDRDNTGYFEVEIPIELPKGEILRAGLTANTDIAVEMLRDVLVVPSQAVVDRKIDELPKNITENSANIPKNNTFARVVFKLQDVAGKTSTDDRPMKKIVAVPVQVGSSDLTRTIVLAGLAKGEQIVTGPFKVMLNLKHDQEVVEEKSSGSEKKGEAGGPPDEPAGPDDDRKSEGKP
jgi:HlyD family secretion protein